MRTWAITNNANRLRSILEGRPLERPGGSAQKSSAGKLRFKMETFYGFLLLSVGGALCYLVYCYDITKISLIIPFRIARIDCLSYAKSTMLCKSMLISKMGRLPKGHCSQVLHYDTILYT